MSTKQIIALMHGWRAPLVMAVARGICGIATTWLLDTAQGHGWIAPASPKLANIAFGVMVATGTREIVTVLGVVAGAATETKASAETVLSTSGALESAATELRAEVEAFLRKVAA